MTFEVNYIMESYARLVDEMAMISYALVGDVQVTVQL